MSVDITFMILLAGGIVLLPLLLDVLSLFGFAWEIPSASRAIYHKVRGHIMVRTPDELVVAMANGLIKAGDVLMAGSASTDGSGLLLIHPSIIGRPAGTKLHVVSIRPRYLVLREIR